MTGGSLGLRSGSYGSLQQQLYSQNAVSSAAAAALPIGSTPASSGRKNPKMLPSGYREKERRLSWIWKLASTRKVGMLLLLVTSVAVLLSFFYALSKDVDQPSGPETVIGYSDNYHDLVYQGRIPPHNLIPPLAPVTENKENITVVVHTNVINKTQPLLPPIPWVSIPLQHPCGNFSLPPSPVDPKRTGPRPCNVCYVPVDIAVGYMPDVPSVSPVVKSLYYISEENLLVNESNGGSIFGGHPSLQQREESFNLKESMTIHCGFAKGKRPGQSTGFDIDEADLLEMEQCRGVVVASAIFGNYDIMQQPKNIGETSKKYACFYMFVDEETEASIRNSSNLNSTKQVGLWRVVVVRNLPYADARRNGKVPKLLLHRLFPNTRFSLWIDGKLELVVDPYQIMERFLWRTNATLAISRHYRRFDVFEEAEANKAAGKYDNSSIDYQIEFYKKEGLTHFSPAKYPISSDVPEGCVIIKEHTPISDLFTCLWFNEVDRFTSRDQLSYSTVRDRLNAQTNWMPNMFLDCERRNFVVQTYHRDVLEQKRVHRNPCQQPSLKESPKLELPSKSTSGAVPDAMTSRSTPKKQSSKRGRDRKSGSKRHRLKGAASIRDLNSF